jgi:hypothetical protein
MIINIGISERREQMEERRILFNMTPSIQYGEYPPPHP